MSEAPVGGSGRAPVPVSALNGTEARLQHGLDLAYRYLGHRDRTVAEMRRHLASKRVEPATIDEVVGELGRAGYLDDERYARRFAEDRRTLDAWGRDRIERRLLSVGVEPELIALALQDRSSGAELEAAIGVLRRRFPVPPASDRDRDRALGMLMRKGYELDLAYDAVRALERE
jgi:regulatory protein